MPRQPKTYQLDLFQSPRHPDVTQTPGWQILPAETRRVLVTLIVRLLLDHAAGDCLPEREEMRHDA